MSITAYVGLPGSGKSYGVVENVLIPAIKSGRRVWTNIPLHVDEWIKDYGYAPIQFDIQDIIDDPDWFFNVFEKGAILVIDEVWRLWASGLKANNALPQHKEFLAEHRHMVGDDGQATDIIFVTQDLSQMASFARVLVEYTYRSTKLTAVGQDKRYRIDVYPGSVTGPNPPPKNRLREIFGSYKPEVYKLYKTATKSDTGEAGDEKAVDDRYNILKGGALKTYAVTIIAGICFAIFAMQKVYAYYFGEEPEQPQSEPVIERQQQPQSPKKPTRPVKRYQDIFEGYDVHIAFNRGNTAREMVYELSAKKNDSVFTISARQLRGLGYTLTSLNNCALILRINGAQRIVTCEAGERKSLVDFNWGVAEK